MSMIPSTSKVNTGSASSASAFSPGTANVSNVTSGISQGINGINGALGQVQSAVQGAGLPNMGPLPHFDQAPIMSLVDQFRNGGINPQQIGDQLRNSFGDYRTAIMNWVNDYRTALQNQFNPQGSGQGQGQQPTVPGTETTMTANPQIQGGTSPLREPVNLPGQMPNFMQGWRRQNGQ